MFSFIGGSLGPVLLGLSIEPASSIWGLLGKVISYFVVTAIFVGPFFFLYKGVRMWFKAGPARKLAGGNLGVFLGQGLLLVICLTTNVGKDFLSKVMTGSR